MTPRDKVAIKSNISNDLHLRSRTGTDHQLLIASIAESIRRKPSARGAHLKEGKVYAKSAIGEKKSDFMPPSFHLKLDNVPKFGDFNPN